MLCQFHFKFIGKLAGNPTSKVRHQAFWIFVNTCELSLKAAPNSVRLYPMNNLYKFQGISFFVF